MQHRGTDTSVSISLAELTRIEDERIQREQAERAQLREQRARERERAEAERRAREAAELAALQTEQERRAREQALEKAREQARERAAIEIARIEAEAKVRLEADNEARAHELAVLRVRRETGRRRRELVLGSAVALLIGLGSVSAYASSERVGELERTTEELRDRERALAMERDEAKRTEVAALDRRHASLLARTVAKDAEAARKSAENARAALNERSPSQERLRAFAESLDALEARIEGIEELAALERRHGDLAAWATSMRRTSATDSARSAAARARAPGAGSDALEAYERALDELRDKLAQRVGSGASPRVTETQAPGEPCRSGDPGCGLDGRRVF